MWGLTYGCGGLNGDSPVPGTPWGERRIREMSEMTGLPVRPGFRTPQTLKPGRSLIPTPFNVNSVMGTTGVSVGHTEPMTESEVGESQSGVSCHAQSLIPCQPAPGPGPAPTQARANQPGAPALAPFPVSACRLPALSEGQLSAAELRRP
ncbi:hypothetical protein EYF80_039741 [Liparis tanakae]|uniref:Uncharacterized protein n=1 Tax=Liparis tanakae TaxID=230148 RepID=A0A4Z2GAT3_9TELE|nr:hypothetical protein EYF80_039741 [Liparis tanakae]